MPTLIDILEASATRFAKRPALTMRVGYRTHTYSYTEVLTRAHQTAQWLAQQGVGVGERVLLLAPNSPDWIIAFWGAMLRGAVVVPLNVQTTATLLAKIVTDTDARLLGKHRRSTVPVPAGLPTIDLELLPEVTAALSPAARWGRPQSDDVFQIIYTSGTTGDPKGVMLAHHNVLANVMTLGQLIPLSPADRFLSILPLSHLYEQTVGFLVPFAHGCHIIYAHSPAAIRELCQEFAITKMVAVPEFLQVVMSRIEATAREAGRGKQWVSARRLAERLPGHALRRLLFHTVHKQFGGKLTTIACGGAPLAATLEAAWNSLGVTVLQGYGLTETSPVLTSNTLSHRHFGSVGRPITGVSLQIAPDGEVLARGPNVFSGYFKDKAKTKASFTPDGWFRTGDSGAFDPDGCLFLKGRKKYMILGPDGQNVYPEDIEAELNQEPDVRDSCVVGITRGGAERIHAVLLPPEGAAPDPGAIVARVNGRLASFQRITSWSLWSESDFPRSATRKVQKAKVIAALTAPLDHAPAPSPAPPSPLLALLADVTGMPVNDLTPARRVTADLNLDSLLRVELVARLEERFGVRLPEAAITPQTTVADLTQLVANAPRAEPPPAPARWPRQPLMVWARFLVQWLLLLPLVRLFVHLTVEGTDHLPTTAGPLIFMPNHTSYLDSAVVSLAVPARRQLTLAFAAAEDVLYRRYRALAWLIEPLMNTFPFPREAGSNIRAGLTTMGRLIDQGFSITVYPEGKMSPTGKRLPLKQGAGLVAVTMGCPVVPVKITGSQQVVPYGKIWPRRRGRVTVHFGTPLTFSRTTSYPAATAQITAAMAAL